MKIADRILLRSKNAKQAIAAQAAADAAANAPIAPQPSPLLPPPEYRGEPLHLVASTTLSPSSFGAPNLDALRNPNPGPMEIDCIKFRIEATGVATGSSAAGDTLQVSGGVVGCKLVLGDFPITNDYIQIYSFDGVEQALNEEDQGQNFVNLSAINALTANTIQDNICTEYLCRLPCPIWVPSGAVVAPTFYHRGGVNQAVTVTISYIARALPVDTPVPKSYRLPYFATWDAKTFSLFNTDSDQSTEQDLVNSNPEDLHLTKMIGRINYFGAVASSTSASTEFENQAATGLGDALSYFQVTMIDSRGFPVVKDSTPFRNVFDQLTRAWQMDGIVLGAGGYYIVSLQGVGGSLGTGTPGTGTPPPYTSAAPTITLQGWREIKQ